MPEILIKHIYVSRICEISEEEQRQIYTENDKFVQMSYSEDFSLR